MGTPEYGKVALEQIVNHGFDVVAVYSQPPKPAGRGHRLQKTPVHLFAEESNIPVLTPKSLRKSEIQEEFIALKADVCVVAAYGLILPKEIIEAPRFGCINIHGSLLPRWRGAAPIQRAIMAGDTETGITIMQMDEGLDTGDMIALKSIPIDQNATAQSIHDQLCILGGEMIVDSLTDLSEGSLETTPQPEKGVTYAHKLRKEESFLDWRKTAEELERQVRAFTPWPGTAFAHNGTTIKVIEVELINHMHGLPGEILDDRLTIACGQGAIRILKLQKPGKSKMKTVDFLNGTSLPKGTILGIPLDESSENQ